MGSYTLVLVFVVMACFLLNLANYEVDGKQIISKEEDLEFEEQLKILNKTPIKTIHSSWGDIYDCIDIYKQPAFDHPFLKNHKIQTKPNFDLNKSRGEALIFRTHVERCPQGTVPIRRTRKEDLIRAKYLTLSTEPMSASKNEYFAGIIYQNKGETFYGATANMSIWKPTVDLDEYSLAEISLRSGWDDQYNRIHVGWTVNPMLYDNNTMVRSFIYWTTDNGKETGCYNTLCPGFVQVDPQITPDVPLNTSTYKVNAIEIQSHIYLDCINFNLCHILLLHNSSEKRWWYAIEGVTIGYWPTEIFPLFNDIGIERIYWGGHSTDNGNGDVPQIGSGHFPNEDFTEAAYFTQIQYNDVSGALLDPHNKKMTKVIGCKKSYDINYYGFLDEHRRHTVQYGGPGGKC
ncbi:hypothetical protein MKW92_008910 [Papaver armeniacum]|nr:hypothetical protein MKW92_008910 [Papaver armeniacum]